METDIPQSLHSDGQVFKRVDTEFFLHASLDSVQHAQGGHHGRITPASVRTRQPNHTPGFHVHVLHIIDIHTYILSGDESSLKTFNKAAHCPEESLRFIRL